MKHIIILLLAWVSVINHSGQDFYVCKNAKITLFSSAPIEDIKAVSSSGASVFNPATGELAFSVPIRSFQFEKSIMQEHFNSDYMESDKFPKAIFKGKIEDRVDITKDGAYPIKVTGSLTVHGVTLLKTVQGSLVVKNGEITMTSMFLVKCTDHHIEIPLIVFHHIAESIQINVSASYIANKSN